MNYYEVARWESGIYIRVHGLANRHNSHLFKDLADTLLQKSYCHFFIDLEHCKGMDSTFMGVLVGIVLYGERVHGARGKTRVMVLNASEHNDRLLASLGLQNIIEIKQEQVSLPEGTAFERLEESEFDPVRRILLIKEAHEHLASIDESNAKIFGPFLENLARELPPDPQQDQ